MSLAAAAAGAGVSASEAPVSFLRFRYPHVAWAREEDGSGGGGGPSACPVSLVMQADAALGALCERAFAAVAALPAADAAGAAAAVALRAAAGSAPGGGGVPPPLSRESSYVCVCGAEVAEVNEGGEVACDACNRWYHLRCLGLPPGFAEACAEFVCPGCTATGGSA